MGRHINILFIQKYSYYRGISSLYKYVLQNRCSEFKLFFYKISMFIKKKMDCICRSKLHNSFFMTRRSLILPFIPVQPVPTHRYYTLSIFMLSGSIQFHSSVLV